MIEKLKQLQSTKMSSSEAREKIASDTAFCNELSTLSERFLKTKVSGCKTCYYDAYVKLMIKKDIMNNCDFDIQAGKLIKDIAIPKDGKKTISRHNITNELALYHLKTNPLNKKYFTRMPSNLDELLESFDIIKMRVIKKRKKKAE